jgi:hypothetical protein
MHERDGHRGDGGLAPFSRQTVAEGPVAGPSIQCGSGAAPPCAPPGLRLGAEYLD